MFLNLIANGFYAVTKRKMETDSSGFEPTVSAATKDLGHAVEIRIRDNGTGIPAEVKEKMFNPFFTDQARGRRDRRLRRPNEGRCRLRNPAPIGPRW